MPQNAHPPPSRNKESMAPRPRPLLHHTYCIIHPVLSATQPSPLPNEPTFHVAAAPLLTHSTPAYNTGNSTYYSLHRLTRRSFILALHCSALLCSARKPPTHLLASQRIASQHSTAQHSIAQFGITKQSAPHRASEGPHPPPALTHARTLPACLSACPPAARAVASPE